MVRPEDIGWGEYREYEGVYYRGSAPFKLPPNATEEEKIIAVITATEGGKFDAFNGYDRCIATAGLVQFCEAGMYGVSDMLGAIAETKKALLAPIEQRCVQSGMVFRINAKGRWRFEFKDKRGEVDTLPEQQNMFLLRSTGEKGSWDEGSREYAREWAAAIATTLAHPEAQYLQTRYTANKVLRFMLPRASAVFSSARTPLALALRAAFLSFAANNPRRADDDLAVAVANTQGRLFTPDGAREALRCLTFNSGVVIYPGRYNKIRPVLEAQYQVDLPDFADELKGLPPPWEAVEVQRALLALGYDLGPAKADGAWGPKSSTALMSFMQSARLPFTDGRSVTREVADALSTALVGVGKTRADLTS